MTDIETDVILDNQAASRLGSRKEAARKAALNRESAIARKMRNAGFKGRYFCCVIENIESENLENLINEMSASQRGLIATAVPEIQRPPKKGDIPKG